MSTKNTTSLSPEEKRARDVRNGLLLAHVVISWVVVVAVRFVWWHVISKGSTVATFEGSDEKAFQTGYITVAAIIAFFFTSYDIVTNADIQWPPLLASAFALGCAAEVTYKLVTERDVIYRNVVALEMAREGENEREAAPVTSAAGGAPNGTAANGTAAVSSTARARAEDGIRLKIGWGLYTALYGTCAMVLLSTYLTFFARREGT